MLKDIKFDVATGTSARCKVWKNKKMSWDEIVSRLSTEHKTLETLKEFLAASKEEQGKIKDVGGFVGGYLRGGQRKTENVLHRQILTLDLDFAHSGFWLDFIMQFECAAVLHGTHKHSKESPRYRLVIPLDREVTPDEYVAIGRKVAGELDIELFDNTTFDPCRLMFWPSSPKDVEYYCMEQKGGALCADDVLAQYVDWTDTSAWPTSKAYIEEKRSDIKRQEDPTQKRGVVGAFCRTYSIAEAISIFLNDKYKPTTQDDRYTFVGGSTACGLVVYDEMFAYSHHGTDPISGMLCNAFDLVRIHLFGHLDNQKDGKQSFEAMELLALNDVEVKKTIAHETVTAARYEFANIDTESDEGDTEAEPEPIDTDWMTELQADRKGNYLASAHNLKLILRNDSRLKNAFKYNSFDNRRYVCKSLPWRKVEGFSCFEDADDAGIRVYIECVYGIVNKGKTDDAVTLEFKRNMFNPVKDYLTGLKWDGVSRVDELLIKNFGVADNVYTREAIRKTLCGAVGRIFDPGCKFDLVLVLSSTTQGTGKSSFFKALGKGWFSDSFHGVKGREAFEQLQGSWIIEMAELSGLKRSEVESVKHFLTKRDDTFRPAYGRIVTTFPRQNIFVATTNEKEYLTDVSGNRRFMPIDVNEVKLLENKELKKFVESPDLIDRVWAEAVALYKAGEKLYLSAEAEQIAHGEQLSHSEADEREGVIEKYLETKLPRDWESRSLFERRIYLDGDHAEGTETRQQVTVAEIWCECLGMDKSEMTKYKTREITNILKNLKGVLPRSTKRTKLYGTQRYYEIKSLRDT